jgi:TadE-like protein
MSNRTRPRAAQALVEFALVLPLMLTVSLGAVQLTLYAHARDVLVSSVQEGARLAAQDGRTIDEGELRAHTLIAAGLGATVDVQSVTGTRDGEIVSVAIDASVRPIVPVLVGLPIHAEASLTQEHFRPAGGGHVRP